MRIEILIICSLLDSGRIIGLQSATCNYYKYLSLDAIHENHERYGMALVFCILHILLALGVGYLSKRVLGKLTDSHIGNYLNEIVSTCEYSTFVFELGVFGRVYGLNASLLAAFCLLVVKNYRLLFQGRTVNPCGLVEYLFTNSKMKYVMKLWSMQLLGAYFSYFYISLIWKLSQSYYHLEYLKYVWDPQQKVGIIVGFTIELSGTFFCYFVDHVTRKKEYNSINPSLSAASCVVVAYVFVETTGVWMNPALATAHVFQRRNNLFENILVYWLAPIMGATLAYQCNTVLNNVIQRRVRKEL